MIEFTCDVSQKGIPLTHAWEHTVGSGHAPLALRADYRAQLARCHRELGFGHVRFHALLCDAMGTLICENNRLLYSFFNADSIMDFLLGAGMRPFVELSFMPETLASGSKTAFRYRANVTPPNDYNAWGTLIRKLVSHWVERYGVAEVSRWFFEVWNEPNLQAFWTAQPQDYFELYRHTATAIKTVDASLRVGGPATAQNAWLAELLDYCDRQALPVDFISTHYYPTDAFGKESTDTLTQLANAPRDVMQQRAQQARTAVGDVPLYYTEWNITSNPRDPLHDEPFAAAFATDIVLSVNGLVDGYSWWTFSDIFEENYFPSLPFHGGFGLLDLYGISKPVYRAFELLHRLGDELLAVGGAHDTVRVRVARQDGGLTVLLTNHALPRHEIQTERVHVCLERARCPHSAFVERIDEDHANARRAWQAMGAPEYPSPRQVSALASASQLIAEPLAFQFEPDSREERDAGRIEFTLTLPPHSVAAVSLV